MLTATVEEKKRLMRPSKRRRLESEDTSDDPSVVVDTKLLDALFPELRVMVYSFMTLQSLGRLAQTCKEYRKQLSQHPGSSMLWIPAQWKKAILNITVTSEDGSIDAWRNVITNDFIRRTVIPSGLFKFPGIGEQFVFQCSRGPFAHRITIFRACPKLEILQVDGSADGTVLRSGQWSDILKNMVDVARLHQVKTDIARTIHDARSYDTLTDQLTFYMQESMDSNHAASAITTHSVEKTPTWIELGNRLRRTNMMRAKQQVYHELLTCLVNKINHVLSQ